MAAAEQARRRPAESVDDDSDGDPDPTVGGGDRTFDAARLARRLRIAILVGAMLLAVAGGVMLGAIQG